MKISVIGCGRWGSFIAWYLNKINHEVILYGRKDSKDFKNLVNTRKNSFLSFDEKTDITSDIGVAINSSNTIVISVGAQNLRNFMESIQDFNLSEKTIVLCMKGIEVSTSKRLTEVVKEFVGNHANVAIWVGPGHVQDFVNGIPNCMVIDSENPKTTEFLIEQFSSDLIRFYVGIDLIGNEIGAAAKNVIGIAAGMLDGINYTSLKGALMARGTREIARLIKAMGGNEMSAYSLCHLGDYQATLFSEYSHNRAFGELFINGKPYDKLSEGVPTAAALVKLAKKHNVDLPICTAVNSIINHKADAQKCLSELFLRSTKKEF